MILDVVRRARESRAEARAPAEEAVRRHLAEHEARAGLLGTAIAEPERPAQAFEVGIEIELIEVRPRVVGRRRGRESQARQVAHLADRRLQVRLQQRLLHA